MKAVERYKTVRDVDSSSPREVEQVQMTLDKTAHPAQNNEYQKLSYEGGTRVEKVSVTRGN